MGIVLHLSIVLSLLGAPIELNMLYKGYIILLLSRLALYYKMFYLATTLTFLVVLLIVIIDIKLIIRRYQRK